MNHDTVSGNVELVFMLLDPVSYPFTTNKYLLILRLK